jgi:hypothetical protein
LEEFHDKLAEADPDDTLDDSESQDDKCAHFLSNNFETQESNDTPDDNEFHFGIHNFGKEPVYSKYLAPDRELDESLERSD